jgi:hypothetical protein
MSGNFGPWATTLDVGSGARLSTFWQRRMAMLATLKNTKARVSWTVGILIALAALAALTLPSVYLSSTRGVMADDAKPPETEFFPPPTDSEKKILAALDVHTKMDFHESPLGNVVAYLADLHGIPIKLHNKALEDAAIGPDSPMNCSINGVSLKSGLNLLLREADLTYLIKNEVLLITTKEKAESELVTRTYPVGDLIDDDPNKAYENLIEVITSTVRPTTWDEVGGPGNIQQMPKSKSLVVSQTLDVHEEALELLRALRAAKKAATQGAQ